MSSNKNITLSEAEDNYRKAIMSGNGKDVVEAKKQLDYIRQREYSKENRSEKELYQLFRDCMENNKISEAMYYYNSSQCLRKRNSKETNKSFEDQIMDEVLKQMSEEE